MKHTHFSLTCCLPCPAWGKATAGLFVFLALVLVASCTSGNVAPLPSDGDTIPMRHAKNITMVRYGDYVRVEMLNPWTKDGSLATYVLADKHADAPEWLGQAVLVRTPLDNALVFAAVHCDLLVELGAERCIGGVCEKQYVSSLTKSVVDCGNGMSPNLERIIQLRPDAMLVSSFENNPGYDKLGQMGVPIIQCAEYMEETALGRAEWMKFFGLLAGKGQEAEAQFDALEARYDSLKSLAQSVSSRPRIVSETLYGNIWYQPGANSTIGQIYADAGAQTAFPQHQQSGSVPLSAEQVLVDAHDAELWLVRYDAPTPKTLRQLASEAPIYSQFDALRNGNVWGCNTTATRFYEQSPFHPDRLLSDIIQIAHPELHLQTPMHYYHRLK